MVAAGWRQVGHVVVEHGLTAALGDGHASRIDWRRRPEVPGRRQSGSGREWN